MNDSKQTEIILGDLTAVITYHNEKELIKGYESLIELIYRSHISYAGHDDEQLKEDILENFEEWGTENINILLNDELFIPIKE